MILSARLRFFNPRLELAHTPRPPLPDNGTLKISYTGGEPETTLKLQACFNLKTHPTLCEGRLPVQLSLTTPDQKRLATTSDLPTFLIREWPKLRATVAKKFPGHLWR
jgi:ATP-dependent helicase HrpB